MRDFVKGFGEVKQDGIYMFLCIYSCYPVMNCLDELGLTRQPDWKPCWKWRMMFCLCKCFHVSIRIMCSITVQRMHDSEMGLYLAGSDLRLVLFIGVTIAWSQSSGMLDVLYDC